MAFAQGPTYSKDVSRIYQAKCQICHRDGDVAPFSLNNYDDATAHALDTRRVILNGSMPPWKPVAGFGEFRDNYSLTADEKQTILDWIQNGSDPGDPADLPDPPANTSAWGLGDPDVLLTVPQSYTPPVDVTDTYRCFVLPDTGFTQDTFLSAVDLRPGNRKIVHHVLVAKMELRDMIAAADLVYLSTILRLCHRSMLLAESLVGPRVPGPISCRMELEF